MSPPENEAAASTAIEDGGNENHHGNGAARPYDEAPAPSRDPFRFASPDRFDWSGPNVVINHRDATAVYLNPDGDLVIRQESPLPGMDDPFVVIPREHLFRVIDEMLRLDGYYVLSGGLQPFDNPFDAEPDNPKRAEPPTVTTPKPMTDAERARRYRERKRHEQPQDSRDGVTDRHDETEPELKLATGGT